MPLQVTRMPGYLGFDRAVGAGACGVSDLGTTDLDAEFFSPAAEVLIEEERRREGTLVDEARPTGAGRRNEKAGK